MAIDFVSLELGERLVDYRAAWAMQREVHAAVADGSRSDTVLLLEHAAVYTAGKRTEPHERPVDETEVIDVDRGGKITWHGPGQLVAYPIVRLPESVGVVDFVRRCEEAMIRTVARFGVIAGRVAGRSGVWLPNPDRKVAAIGIRVASNVTMHGIAINVSPDLAAFDAIVPCGIADAGTTSIVRETGRDVTVAEVAAAFSEELEPLLAFEPYESSPDADALADGQRRDSITASA